MQTENIDRVFTVLDMDGNDEITWADFEQVTAGLATEFGQEPNSGLIQDLLAAYARIWNYVREAADVNQDDSVGKAEFRDAHDQGLLTASDLMDKWLAAADACFAIADTDGDGYIDQDELTRVYRGAGITDPAVAAAAFAAMDSDNDDRIDNEEFCANVRGVFTATHESMKGAHMLRLG
ncbi:EF-hand domain-containing protein [Actinokineospora iranica]|uniref:EF-hand domain-containing protein n=1 Tax=Actinokineospora iranica TaxID=1271860 RepID=UPI001587F3A3|nr:EF-hand domain-containing protein [Actinokineospora iranica]